VDFPINHGDFPVRYVSHYQRVCLATKKQCDRHSSQLVAVGLPYPEHGWCLRDPGGKMVVFSGRTTPKTMATPCHFNQEKPHEIASVSGSILKFA